MEATHLHGEGVLRCADNVCHIKLGRETAVLAVPQQLPIQPGIEGIVDSLKMDGDPAVHAWNDQLPVPLIPSHESVQSNGRQTPEEATPLALPGGWNCEVLAVASSGVVLRHEWGGDWPGVLKICVNGE